MTKLSKMENEKYYSWSKLVTLSLIVGESSCDGEKGGVEDDDDDGDCGDEEVEVERDTVGGDGEVEGDTIGGDGDGDGEGEGEGDGEVSHISCNFLLLKLPFSSLLLMSLAGIVPRVSPNM